MKHRIQFDPNAKQSTFGKIVLEFCFLLQLICQVTFWTVMFVLLEEYAYICICVIVFFSWFVVKFILLTNLETDRCLWNKINSFSKAKSLDLMYWTAIISSWISPVTVWYNFIADSYLSEKEREKNTSKRKLFLLIVSSTTIFIEFTFISIIALIISFSDILPLSEGSLLLHCIQNSSFVNETNTNFSWIKLCTFNQDCQIERRICENGERPMDLILNNILPYIYLVLMFGWIGLVGLQIFGSFLKSKNPTFGKKC